MAYTLLTPVLDIEKQSTFDLMWVVYTLFTLHSRKPEDVVQA